MGERSADTMGSQGRRVLVVDDSPDLVELMSDMLSVAGHVAFVANDGESAIRLALEIVPDIVFLDIGLPKMDGFEVARRLRAIEILRETVLVALTGYGTDQDLERARGVGIDLYIVKPAPPETIWAVVRDGAACQESRTVRVSSFYGPSRGTARSTC